jgi:hypothetical protein
MDNFFTYLQTHRSGILLLLLILASIVFFVQWIMWVLARGRFSRIPPADSKAALRFIFSDAAVKIINDFRHLLALIIVLIFAFALGYALIKAASIETNAQSPTTIANIKEALQAVVATLGGLVGSIIGYYFGESSVVKSAEQKPPDSGQAKLPPAVQEPPKSGETKAPPPPKPVGN